MPTGKKCPQGKNAHREKMPTGKGPQGKMPTGEKGPQ